MSALIPRQSEHGASRKVWGRSKLKFVLSLGVAIEARGGVSMQDVRTGRMVPIEEEKAKELERAGDVPVFHVGEEVMVKGGRFRVRKITRKDVILRGIPVARFESRRGDRRGE
jgi:hypothetical protein